MKRLHELERENEALRDRLARLSEASLRITEDLDFSSVLQGVLDSARALTEARYGVVVLHNEAGVIGDFLSSGLTADEADRLWAMPGLAAAFRKPRQNPRPAARPRPAQPRQVAGTARDPPPCGGEPAALLPLLPVLHRGERVGSIYLAEKERGQQFTREDEETLVLFASQAAMAIANAHRHREERRARAGLETLIDTSPVGVAVFDAATGAPKTFNREVRRIVDSLCNPDQTPEMLLDLMTGPTRATGARSLCGSSPWPNS